MNVDDGRVRIGPAEPMRESHSGGPRPVIGTAMPTP